MSLSRYQRAGYHHQADIYKPTLNAYGPAYPSYPTYTAVRCKYDPTANFSEPHPQGRQLEVNVMTSDYWEFTADQDIGDAYLIKLTTPGHPAYGKFWIAEGDGTAAPNEGRARPNYQEVYAKQFIPPAGVS